MSEVNEAAQIITESIDRDAKVIFGAVQDDKLKKGEIKITVVATGFSSTTPETTSLFQEMARLPRIKEPLFVKEESELRDDVAIRTRPKVFEAQISSVNDDEADDEFSVPAFIRRKMK